MAQNGSPPPTNSFYAAIHPHLRRLRECKHLPSSVHPEFIITKRTRKKGWSRLKVILGLKALGRMGEKYTFFFIDRN